MMLRAYFDDAGSHASSDVVVLAGLIGTVAQWEVFNRQWSEKLNHPLPGKPPLKMFHLSACNARRGEFRRYSDAEQDAVIHDFRQIVIDARLTSVASAIDRRAWDELIVGGLRNVLGEALSACFVNCLFETVRIVEPHEHHREIVAVFDKGIETTRLQKIGEMFTRPPEKPRVVSVEFASVQKVLPLQGADIIATENYWHAAEWLKLGELALPRPHLSHYLRNMLHQGQILDREAIGAEVHRRGAGGMLLQ
jgi:hypothetical protein